MTEGTIPASRITTTLSGPAVTINGDRDRRPGVHQRTDLLNSALDAVESIIGVLHERLAEVTLDEDTVLKPALTSEGGVIGDGSWLARYFDETRARVIRMGNHLAALTERVDL